MLYVLILMILLALSNEGNAALSKELLAFAKKQTVELQEEANKLIQKGDLFEESKPHKKRCSTQKVDFTDNNSESSTLRILVFVSFSMPKASLKELSRQAKKYNAVLVMRGLYQDSFVKTAQKLEELDIDVDIDPDVFEKYHITKVPTFIQIQAGSPIRRLSGNVTLPFCAEKFGEVS